MEKFGTYLNNELLTFTSGDDDVKVALHIQADHKLQIFPGKDFLSGLRLDYCIVIDEIGQMRDGSGGREIAISPHDTVFVMCSAERLSEKDAPEIIGYKSFIVLRITPEFGFHPEMSYISIPVYSSDS